MYEEIRIHLVKLKIPGSGRSKMFIKVLCVKSLVSGGGLRVTVHHGHCMPSSSQVPGTHLTLFQFHQIGEINYKLFS